MTVPWFCKNFALSMVWIWYSMQECSNNVYSHKSKIDRNWKLLGCEKAEEMLLTGSYIVWKFLTQDSQLNIPPEIFERRIFTAWKSQQDLNLQTLCAKEMTLPQKRETKNLSISLFCHCSSTHYRISSHIIMCILYHIFHSIFF